MRFTIKAGGATSSFQIDQAPEALKLLPGDFYDLSKAHELHSDKSPFKFVPCGICRRPMLVNTFYVLAWAKCSTCGGEETREKASIGVAQAGKTEPALAVNLAECLLNPEFAMAICPVQPGNEDHVMELKSVSHAPNHGPGEWRQTSAGRVYVQIEKGETVMHQCLKCKAVVTYSTTAQSQFRRINEPTEGKHVNGWAEDLGVRDGD